MQLDTDIYNGRVVVFRVRGGVLIDLASADVSYHAAVWPDRDNTVAPGKTQQLDADPRKADEMARVANQVLVAATEQSFDKLSAENKELHTRIASLEGERADLRADLDNAHRTESALRDGVDGLQTRIGEVARQRDVALNKFRQLNNALQTAQARETELRKKLTNFIQANCHPNGATADALTAILNETSKDES